MRAPEKASDRVYARLRDDILDWRIPAGTALSEVELAERLGVSRTPLRAALVRLALEGLIDTSHGRTAVVPDVSVDTVRGLFELREALEVQAARLAARRGLPERFRPLAAEFARASRLVERGAVDEYYAVVARFDLEIDRALGDGPLRRALDGARTHLARARRLAQDDPARLLRAAGEHAAICEAVAAGDAELAAAATLVHLRASLTTIIATLAAARGRKETA